MDLQQLLAAARTGDEEAFRSFVEPYLGAAYRTALLIALDRELARDAVQEALVRVFQNLDRIRPAEPFRPWFMRVVINEARRVARSQRRQPALLGELPDIPATAVAAPEAQVLAADDRRVLWEALSELDDLHRTVLVLRYYQELSEAEMAEALGVSPGTVKSRLHNARRRLEERLARRQRQPWPLRLLQNIQGRLS